MGEAERTMELNRTPNYGYKNVKNTLMRCLLSKLDPSVQQKQVKE